MCLKKTSKLRKVISDIFSGFDVEDGDSHDLNALNSLYVISSLLFGFCISLWFSGNNMHANRSEWANLAFHCSLNLSTVGSGYSVLVLTMQYYYLNIKRHNKPNDEWKKQFLKETRPSRRWSILGILLSFLGIYLSIIFNHVANNNQVKEIASNGIILGIGVTVSFFSLRSIYIAASNSYSKHGSESLTYPLLLNRSTSEQSSISPTQEQVYLQVAPTLSRQSSAIVQ